MKVHQIACVSALWWLQEPVDGLRHDPGRPTQPAASSALPSRADGWFELAHRGARARFRYRDALQVPGAPLGAGRSGMVYAGGLGAGTVVEVVEVGGGLKDSVVLPAAPSGGRIAYSIDLGNLSGLRAVDGVTELLDAGGTPRLRVGRPIVTDANGVVRPVRVAIRGCAFDSDPRAPWGRPVVRPGARTCSLELSLPEDLAFPATVDPLWGPTGAMIDARVGSRQGENTPLVLIESGPLAGKVLAMGGVSSVPTSLPDPTSNVLAAAELFDPVTETWAATAPLPSARKSHIHAFVELPAGPFVLVAGGCPESLSCTAQAQSWIYDTTTGTWSNTAGPHVAPRGYSRAVRLDDGRVLVMGGFASGAFLSSAELFDPQAGTWTSAASMNAARVRFGFTRLFDGRVLVAGGGGIGTELGDGEVYDPVTNTWVEDADGTPALVMELLEGESLAERLRRAGPLPLAEACGVLVCVASAVGAAHAQGIVHRDLKPENIFLAQPGGTVKVLDFGIAKWAGAGASDKDSDQESATTASGAILGTPAFMAPEQVFGEHDVDHRADVWALGLVLYECLSGHLPTRADNVGQVLKNIVAKQIPALSARVVDAPAEVVALVERMLNRDRAKRPASLREVTEVLERHTDVRAPSFDAPRPVGAPAAEAASPSGDLGPGDPTLLSGELGALARPRRQRRLPAVLWAGGGVVLASALSWGVFAATTSNTQSPPPSNPAHEPATMATAAPGPSTAMAAPASSAEPSIAATTSSSPSSRSPTSNSPNGGGSTIVASKPPIASASSAPASTPPPTAAEPSVFVPSERFE